MKNDNSRSWPLLALVVIGVTLTHGCSDAPRTGGGGRKQTVIPEAGGVYSVAGEKVGAAEKYTILKVLRVDASFYVYRTYQNILDARPETLDPSLDLSGEHVPGLGSRSAFNRSGQENPEAFSAWEPVLLVKKPLSEVDNKLLQEIDEMLRE